VSAQRGWCRQDAHDQLEGETARRQRGRIRDTMTVPPASADGLAARQVLYETRLESSVRRG
jgi:hypothetical protein